MQESAELCIRDISKHRCAVFIMLRMFNILMHGLHSLSDLISTENGNSLLVKDITNILTNLGFTY